MKKINRAIYSISGLGLLILLFVCTPAQALDFDFSGNMTYHNDVLQFNFTSGGAGNVTLFSSSWDDGGFDPMLGLWESDGDSVYFQDDGHILGSTLSNGVSYDHGSWDSYYTAPVAVGNYLVTLTAFYNWPNGGNLADGFSYDGQTPIPITSWDQPANGYKNPNYEFHILNVTSAGGPGGQVPEPSTFLLVSAGLAGVGLLRKRFKK